MARVSLCLIKSLSQAVSKGTIPPLPPRVIATPPPEIELGMGGVPTDRGLFTFRNWALTWESCLSYNHAACCSRKLRVTSNLSALPHFRRLSLRLRCRQVRTVHALYLSVALLRTSSESLYNLSPGHLTLLKWLPKGPDLSSNPIPPTELLGRELYDLQASRTRGGSTKSSLGKGRRMKTV